LPGLQQIHEMSNRKVLPRVLLWINLIVSIQADSSDPFEGSLEDLLGSLREVLCPPNSCCHEECLDIAFSISTKMDEKVDPCNDFYGFACDKFLHEAPLPRNGIKLEGSTDITIVQLKSILEDEIHSNDLRAFKNIKNYYKICTNETLVEEQGLEPLHNILREFGGWPVLYADKSIGSNASWMDSVYKSRKLGYPLSSFITLRIVIDPKNSTHRVLQLNGASLVLSKEHLSKGEDDTIVKEYLSFMIDIAEMLGAPKERARIEMQESLRFGISLANISLGEEMGHNATELFKMTTVRELIREFPSIPWLDYINKLLAPNVIVAEDESVMVPVSPYIAGLEKLLKETSNRTLANYAIWRVVKKSIGYLNRRIRERQEAYLSIFYGTDKVSKWYKCLLSVDWMDKDTKEAALGKARSMSQFIGYPDDLVQDLKIEEYYQNFSVDPKTSFLHASLSISRTFQDKNFGKLREPVDSNEWIYEINPINIFAAYVPKVNSIVLTASYFQGEYFKPDIPNYVSYGTIGMVVGHEIMHAFDDLGKITELGTNNNTRAEFDKRVQCLINQANNYTFTEGSMKVNGTKTRRDIVADNEGFRVAYRAYKLWEKIHGEEQKIYTLEKWNSQQMFWISGASVWCTAYEPGHPQSPDDVHPPEEFRINGVLSNIPEFSKDFNCPVGSKMNPRNKCNIWGDLIDAPDEISQITTNTSIASMQTSIDNAERADSAPENTTKTST
ncbi:hypothetical protein QAD02_004547, partial [Eretmocerus hayati]